MRIVYVATLYPGYLADFERRHPEVAGLTFEEHRHVLYRDAFGWSDYFVRHLTARGHAGFHIVANYTALQEKWSIESGIAWSPMNSSFPILRAQVRAFQPDVLFVEDCFAYPAPRIRALTDAAPTIRGVACYHGFESDVKAIIPRDALLLTCAGPLVKDWHALGFRTGLVRHAFEPDVLDVLPQPGAQSSLTFMGSCSPLLHPERHAWLSAIAEHIPELDVWTDSFNFNPRALARITFSSLARGRVRRVWGHINSPVRRQNRGAVYGLSMLAKLRESRTTLNHHSALSKPSAGNMRLFEATGTGACLVTDAKPDMDEIFVPDAEIVCYSSTAECVEKVRWLIDHPAKAAEIGRCGQQRTLRDHTFALRAGELEALLLDHLRDRGSRPS